MTLRFRLLWLVVGVLLSLPLIGVPGSAAAADKARRVALVIGINAYKNAPPLSNPVNDARAIGDSLRRLDFDVTEAYDADQRTFTSQIRAFGNRASSADVAVVYFAGHGVQVDRENYLIPSDAKLERERDLLYDAIPVERLLGEVSQARKIGILLLDSCRNNPFTERGARAMTITGRAVATVPGMARVDNVPRNTMVVTAAKADQIAEDGQDHSPFAAAILAHLQVPGLELGLFFRSVRDTVLRSTGNRQEPYVFSSLGADPFYFYPRPPNRPPEIGPVQPLTLTDNAGPTPLRIPQPTDPDQDPLTIRIIGLPRSGEVRVEDRVAVLNTIVTAERFKSASYKPDGKTIGPVGTIDMLIEDGRGGSVTARLPITVRSSHRPPTVASPARVRIVRQPLGIPAPVSQDGEPLTVSIKALPRGVVSNSGAVLRVGDRLTVNDLTKLSFMPEAGLVGSAGSLRYAVDNGYGDVVEGAVDIEVAEPGGPRSADVARGPSERDERPAPITKQTESLIARLVAEMPAVATGREAIASGYLAQPGFKALAISPAMRGSWRSSEWPTPEVAKERALEKCQVMYGTPCLLFAQDDRVFSPPSGADWTLYDMPHVRYAGTFDPANIPTLTETTRSGPTVANYTAARQPKAMAIHPRGLVFSATAAASKTAAEEQALEACNADPERKGQDGPCYLYASGNRVVLPRRLTSPDPYP